MTMPPYPGDPETNERGTDAQDVPSPELGNASGGAPDPGVPAELRKRRFDELFEACYYQLKDIVRMVGGHRKLGVSTTQMVSDLFLRMRTWLGERDLQKEDILHPAGAAVRCLIVDLVRKEPKVTFVTLSKVPGFTYPIERHLDVDRMLRRLYDEQPRLAQTIDQRFFGGCTVHEIAASTNVATATAERNIRRGQAWLMRELKDKSNHEI